MRAEEFTLHPKHQVAVVVATGLAPVLMLESVQEINAFKDDIQGVSPEVARKLINAGAAIQGTIEELLAMANGAPPTPAKTPAPDAPPKPPAPPAKS